MLFTEGTRTNTQTDRLIRVYLRKHSFCRGYDKRRDVAQHKRKHLYKITLVTQFFNISASGLSQEKRHKFIYFVDVSRMPLLYTGCDVIVKYTTFDSALIKLTLIDSGNL